MTEEQFYEIWNRACMENGGVEPLEGDGALTKMLLGHGYIMNGGLEHFADLSEQEQKESISGFRFFAFDDIADMILNAPKLSESELADAEKDYVQFDSRIMECVKSHIEANPHQFHRL